MRHQRNPHCRCPNQVFFDWPLSWEEPRGPTGKDCHLHVYVKEPCDEPLWGEEPFPPIPSARDLLWGHDDAEGCSAIKPSPEPSTLQEAALETISDHAHEMVRTSTHRDLYPHDYSNAHKGAVKNFIFLEGGPKSFDGKITQEHTAYHSSSRKWYGKPPL